MFVNLLEVPLQARETETPLEKLKLHRHLAQVGRALLQVLGTELETGKSYIRESRDIGGLSNLEQGSRVGGKAGPEMAGNLINS